MMHVRFIAITLLISFSSTAFAQQSGSTLSFLSYNVYHGFNNDSTIRSQYVNWVKKLDPDIIAYQELNGYTQDSLEVLAAKYDHPYAILNTGVTHPIGITSRYPIVMVQQVTTNMWHSYLYGNINGVHVFVTHLSPFEVKLRRADIDRVIAHTKLISPEQKIIVAGDFNALAAKDSANYSQAFLNALLKSNGRLEPKSGLPIVKYKTIYRDNLNNDRIDYTVTDRMLTAGFSDAFYLTNKHYKVSAPTKGHATKNSWLKRIDYIWVNQAAANRVTEADIIHDAVTDRISDHYPVYIKMKL